MFGRSFTEKIAVPFLLLLSKDEVWGVRKSCCEAFVDVARNCGMKNRRHKLAPQFIAFLNDQSRWVSQMALQKLGPFIATFADEIRMAREIKDGRLIAANSGIISEPPGTRMETVSDVDEWNAVFESQMPPGVAVPEDCLAECEQLTKNDKKHLIVESNGVAASCSTHSDLTKLFLDDTQPFSYENTSSQEGQKCKLNGDACEVFSNISYWSPGFCDVGTATYQVNHKRTSQEEFITDYIRRHIDSLYPVTNEILQTSSASSESRVRNSGDVEDGVMEVDELEHTEPQIHEVQDVVPQDLLDCYVHMISPEGDINRHCAHNFPAVAFTVGRNNWPCIMGAYVQLSSDVQWRVRQSLAASMHEIAAIIGEESADAHLVPIFEKFAQDVGEVKFGLLKHLYDFLKLLTPGMRRELLKVLPTFLHCDSDNERNWRYRLEYVRQCIHLCELYDMHEINQYLAAIALTAANDRVAEVRKEATTLLACILGRFVREEWTTSSRRGNGSPIPITESFVCDIVRGFAHSKSWQRRQIFALFCEKILSSEILSYEQFSSLLLDDLMRLKSDAVANVRIAFARALSKTRGGRDFHGQRDFSTVRHGLEELTFDDDIDCRRAARQSLGMEDTENIIDVRSRAKKVREREDNMLGSLYAEGMEVDERNDNVAT